MPTRRTLISLAALGGAGWAASRWYADQGIMNPCLPSGLPEELQKNEIVQSVWEGIDPAHLWDCHVHLVGVGDANSGAYTNPKMEKLSHPWQYLQRKFYFNATCVDESAASAGLKHVDVQYIDRLRDQLKGMVPAGTATPKLMLMAFDWHRNERGEPVPERSTFMMPHDWVVQVVRQYPDDFEWTASVHPYRPDAIEALREAHANGARAVKWLPAAQGMDPASARCDPFYKTLAELNLPLIVHGGEEQAVEGAQYQELCNPLRLRRALDLGVRIIVAHVASLGTSIDLDQGESGPQKPAIKLFERLMDVPEYEGQLFGDLSAITQRNRIKTALPLVLRRDDWGGRLLHATDYPLPGVMALFSLRWLTGEGYLTKEESKVITEVHQHNALLFDLMVKRLMKKDGKRLAPSVFETRHVFT